MWSESRLDIIDVIVGGDELNEVIVETGSVSVEESCWPILVVFGLELLGALVAVFFGEALSPGVDLGESAG